MVEELLLVATIHVLAMISPGPDFAVVLKTSLVHGRASALWVALGISVGIAFHAAYSIVGLAVIVSQSILLFNVIKYAGAAYLVWLGLKALRSSGEGSVNSASETPEKALSRLKSFRQGLLTNILNPKATLYFLSLFTQVIDPNTAFVTKSGYGVFMVAATLVWFSLVAIFMTQRPIEALYQKAKTSIEKAFGIVLVALGIKVAVG